MSIASLHCGPPPERYELEGKVVSVEADAGRVTVAHKEVPGFMGAMTMPFPVADRQILASMQEGDKLRATLVVQGSSHWLEDLVVSRSTASGSQYDPDTPRGPEPGTEVPDVELTNQDGDTIRVSDFQGKAVVVTFIYTRCPLVEFCPRMNANFGVLEQALSKDEGLYEKSHLLTVSFDPEFDTPELLRTFALQQPAITEKTFAHWDFATGTQEQVRTLGFYLGLMFGDGATTDEIVHNLRTGLIAPDGTLAKLYLGNEWTPEDVLTDLSALVNDERSLEEAK